MAGSGKFDETKGRFEKGIGEITGDEKLRREGNLDKASGKIKQGIDELKERGRDVMNRWDDEKKTT